MSARRKPPDNKHVGPLHIEYINPSVNPLRPLVDEAVQRLAVSMQRIGLKTPITVRYCDGKADGTVEGYEVVAGRHRVAAATSLGWETIDVIEIECSDLDARLWEIAENLHRAELTKLQRDEQVAEWIRLTDVAQVEPHRKAGQQPGGVRAAARELGVDRNAARRAVKVAGLSDEAKAAAIEHGLDDNRSALLEAAGEDGPEAQVAKIVARAAKPKATPNKTENDLVDDDPKGDRHLYVLGARHSIMFASYDGPIDDEIVSTAAQVAKSWSDLHDKLKGNRNVRRDNVGVKSKADRAKSRLERDRKTCVSLDLNTYESNRAQFLLDHPRNSAPP
jgi:ParB/RepB/Spo0J family partition protein